ASGIGQARRRRNASCATFVEEDCRPGGKPDLFGARREQPFVPVNCGAIPDTLVESQFFGHRRGSFTDAKENQPGAITLARSGTLFLDEVEALTPKAQVTLLRFLQDQRF